MRGDEARVARDFAGWLSSQGWTVRTEVDFVDIVAEKDGQRLYAEVKGATAPPRSRRPPTGSWGGVRPPSRECARDGDAWSSGRVVAPKDRTVSIGNVRVIGCSGVLRRSPGRSTARGRRGGCGDGRGSN
jgi:hypothetical protein